MTRLITHDDLLGYKKKLGNLKGVDIVYSASKGTIIITDGFGVILRGIQKSKGGLWIVRFINTKGTTWNVPDSIPDNGRDSEPNVSG